MYRHDLTPQEATSPGIRYPRTSKQCLSHSGPLPATNHSEERRREERARTQKDISSHSRLARPLFAGDDDASRGALANDANGDGAHGSHHYDLTSQLRSSPSGGKVVGTPRLWQRPSPSGSEYTEQIRQARGGVERAREALSAQRGLSNPGGRAALGSGLGNSTSGAVAWALADPAPVYPRLPVKQRTLRRQTQSLIGALEEWQTASVEVAHVNDRLVRRMRLAMLLKNISRRYDQHSCTSAVARWLSFVAANKEAEIMMREYEERQRVYGTWKKVPGGALCVRVSCSAPSTFTY